MKYMPKIYLSRWIATVGALAGFAIVIIIQRMIFTITLEATLSVMLVGMLFTGIAYGTSWVISMVWKSSRDTMIHEMGDYELKIMRGVIEQAIAAREKKS